MNRIFEPCDNNSEISIKSEKNEKQDPNKKPKVECDKLQSTQIDNCTPPLKNITHPLRYYEFTRDEIKVLEECDKESFYRRCLPFSTLFATVTYAAVKYGLLKKNRHLGAFPKVLIAFLLGHFYGRYSYLPECEDKIIRMPCDSYLANVMRQHYCENQCREQGGR